MADHNDRPWLNIFLGLLCIGAIVAAYVSVGQASQSAGRTSTTATVQKGVVQSTVSGSGNIQAASELDLGFKTGGTVTHIYVTQGQHVAEGQLLATLDPQSAEVSLEQAKATLLTAEANLAQEEENDGETSVGGQNTADTLTESGPASAARTLQVAYSPTATTAAATSTSPAQTSEPTAASTPAGTPAATTPENGAPSSTSTTPSTTNKQAGETKPSKTSGSSAAGSSKGDGSSSSSATISSATREANLASARASVKSDKLTVQSAEETVQDTELRAPADGTIVALSGEVGETVSGSGTTKASSASSSSAGAGSGSGAGAGSSSAASSSGSSGSSSSSAGSSFAVLSNLSSLQLVVPLSESEVLNVHAGQTATVTIEALASRKVAAHVLHVASLSTSTSGVVSYDVTFQLDQTESGLKSGMSATAEVVVAQAEGVNVPTSAISGGAVTVVSAGKQVRRAVTTGLAGDSSTIILSGLDAGEEIALPVATSTSSSSSSLRSRSRTGGTLGTGGFSGGGFAGAGGGFAGRGGPP